jgi:hypothetical protein
MIVAKRDRLMRCLDDAKGLKISDDAFHSQGNDSIAPRAAAST